MYSRGLLDSCVDTTVTGLNFCISGFNGKVYDISPYCDDYEDVKVEPIVHSETAWKSLDTGQTYILVLREALCMGDTLDHIFVILNQLCHYWARVQDNSIS